MRIFAQLTSARPRAGEQESLALGHALTKGRQPNPVHQGGTIFLAVFSRCQPSGSPVAEVLRRRTYCALRWSPTPSAKEGGRATWVTVAQQRK